LTRGELNLFYLIVMFHMQIL